MHANTMTPFPLLTDTHCHLNDSSFDGRVAEVLARAKAGGVGQVVVPGWDEASSRRAVALAEEFPSILPAVGLHPWVTTEADLTWVEELASEPSVVAIGEIGLDGVVDVPLEAQLPVFRAQLTLARELNLPALIHCRRAWEPLLTCLREASGVRGVLHAFNGSVEVLRACLEMGLYVAFGGGVTRPNNRRAHRAAIAAPADRLLLETDAPAIGIEGVPPAEVEPRHIVQVLHRLAELRGEEAAALAASIAIA
ncbi:MAG: putative deoxyribonuclease YjjV [bacterium ADurb.Bin429]|nr:MAG: putative deoxyribonuclease YjjV [bacterium ADurb.Bin429]